MLVDHIEEFLGPIQDSYIARRRMESFFLFQVVHCPRGIEGLRAFSTVGLSNFSVRFSSSAHPARTNDCRAA